MDQLGEFLEKIRCIMRTGRGLGVVLDAEDWQFAVAHALDSAIVKIDVGDFDFRWQRVRIDGKAVVLGSDGDFAAAQILDRLVAASVAELEFEGGAAECVGEDLVAQANAENGQLA